MSQNARARLERLEANWKTRLGHRMVRRFPVKAGSRFGRARVGRRFDARRHDRDGVAVSGTAGATEVPWQCDLAL